MSRYFIHRNTRVKDKPIALQSLVNFGDKRPVPSKKNEERGIGLVIVIIIMAFLMIIGVGLVTMTSTGREVAGNYRFHQQAFNAAEAGFDDAWTYLSTKFSSSEWTSFEGHTVTEPAGIDLPDDANYFRKKTDEELLALIDSDGDGYANSANVIYFYKTYVAASGGGIDSNYHYTAFLIDDEAGSPTPDPTDVLMVCIGVVNRGGTLVTTRLEIELVLED